MYLGIEEEFHTPYSCFKGLGFFCRKVNDEKMNTYKDFCKSLDSKDLPSCLMRDLKASPNTLPINYISSEICIYHIQTCTIVNIIALAYCICKNMIYIY